MATTSRYGWPTPDPADIPDVPGDMAGLAGAIEEAMGTIDDRLTTFTGLSQSVMQYTSLTNVSLNAPEIPDSQWTPLQFPTAQKNLPASSPGWTQAQNDRIICQQTGLYRLSGFAGFAMNPAGSRGIAFRVNGNPSYPAITTNTAPADIEWYGCVDCEVVVAQGDFLQLVVRQTSGARLRLDTVYPRFSMQRVI
jgi:hypothetical protein